MQIKSKFQLNTFRVLGFVVTSMLLLFNPTNIWGCELHQCRERFMTKKEINKVNHMINGNITKPKVKIFKKLKILHLNKGSKFLTNSNELINDLIFREDPDIFALAESNINYNFDDKEIGDAYKN